MQPLRLYLEVHVDDDVLGPQPGAWPEAAALLDELARRAEGAGGALCFRIREDFARGDRKGFLRGLQRRGHEIGWHAHGSGLEAAVSALRSTGVHTAALVGAPGLVQVEMGRMPAARMLGRAGPWLTRQRARRLLETAWGLGLRVLTDRRAIREFGWQGKLPWVIDLGAGRELVSLDVTADPFAWGVLRRGADRVHHARGTLDWEALEALVQRRELEPAVGEHPPYFGLTVHEHNFCALGSLRPIPAALDGLSRWLDRRGRDLKPSGTLGGAPVRPGPEPRREPVAALFSKLRSVRTRRGGADEGAVEHPVPVDGREVRALWFVARPSKGIVVAVHGGEGGCTQRLGFLAEADGALARLGWTLVVFDRTAGIARTPGNPIHVADTAAVLDAALAEARARKVPLRVLTWSGGLVPAVLSGLVGVERLVDVEGPADRYSLVPPGKPEHELTLSEVFDEPAWDGREALQGIARFTAAGGVYVRVQGRPDHVHGNVDLHATAAVAAARSGREGAGRLVLTPGPVREHGAAVLQAVVRDD